MCIICTVFTIHISGGDVNGIAEVDMYAESL